VVYGYVKSESGVPIEGVEVLLTNKNTNESISTITQDDGGWSTSLSNFDKGCKNGDEIIISARIGPYLRTTSIIANTSSFAQQAKTLIFPEGVIPTPITPTPITPTPITPTPITPTPITPTPITPKPAPVTSPITSTSIPSAQVKEQGPILLAFLIIVGVILYFYWVRR
jgi:cell division septation protein DedD